LQNLQGTFLLFLSPVRVIRRSTLVRGRNRENVETGDGIYVVPYGRCKDLAFANGHE
jgi:hypothetical protein